MFSAFLAPGPYAKRAIYLSPPTPLQRAHPPEGPGGTHAVKRGGGGAPKAAPEPPLRGRRGGLGGSKPRPRRRVALGWEAWGD